MFIQLDINDLICFWGLPDLFKPCEILILTSNRRKDMTSIIALFFFGFLVLGMPIAFVLGVTALVAILKLGTPGLLELIPIKVYNGIDIFPLMAMPLFIRWRHRNRTGSRTNWSTLPNDSWGHM
jgi:hypothetical protein